MHPAYLEVYNPSGSTIVMPSRCLSPLLSTMGRFCDTQCSYFSSPRMLSSVATAFQDFVTRPTSRYQIYTSRSQNPYLNLSIEHFLLQSTPADSTVLFFYVDRPSVVIGRNQNPWLEANLRLLPDGHVFENWQADGKTSRNTRTSVDLVRRRSGGGAVFHDTGNVNYCVICPPQDFTRDKHAEMIVEAIRRDNPRARVNERHDIVLDQGPPDLSISQPEPTNMHETRYCRDQQPSLKVSGSAYKLTRTRSLHHGTCLLDSPNLVTLLQHLKSPARAFIKAKGVDSVRSPVGNVYSAFQPDASGRFQQRVLEAFASRYGLGADCTEAFLQARKGLEVFYGSNWVCGSLDETVVNIPKVNAGMSELQAAEWIYGQTPRFSISSHSVEEDERVRPKLPSYFPETVRLLGFIYED